MAATVKQYKMGKTSGICLIINNENFGGEKRDGSQEDVDSLKDVFTILGFNVVIRKDLTTSEIKDLMTLYSKETNHGDCFVCCVLSHGNENGVLGRERKICPLNDIISPFDGDNCPGLIGKPKVFFIQACRGGKMQSKVKVYEDQDISGGQSGAKSDRVFYSISQSSDFLIAMSTVDGYFSIRNGIKGSWFIQSLCKHLKEGSKSGLNILNVLTDVNDEVSRMEGGEKKNYKMTPAIYFTLRKTLIFRAH